MKEALKTMIFLTFVTAFMLVMLFRCLEAELEIQQERHYKRCHAGVVPIEYCRE